MNLIPRRKTGEKRQCRICLGEDEKKCFISPCNCKGTMKYIHKRCLLYWLQIKISQMHEYIGSVTSFPCELCGGTYFIKSKLPNLYNIIKRGLIYLRRNPYLVLRMAISMVYLSLFLKKLREIHKHTQHLFRWWKFSCKKRIGLFGLAIGILSYALTALLFEIRAIKNYMRNIINHVVELDIQTDNRRLNNM